MGASYPELDAVDAHSVEHLERSEEPGGAHLVHEQLRSGACSHKAKGMDVKGHPPPTHHADTHAPQAARAIVWEEGTGEEERAGRGGEEGEGGDVPQVGARTEVAGGGHGRGGVARSALQ